MRRGATTGMTTLSMNDRWLLAMMTGPVFGTFLRPSTRGRYSILASGAITKRPNAYTPPARGRRNSVRAGAVGAAGPCSRTLRTAESVERAEDAVAVEFGTNEDCCRDSVVISTTLRILVFPNRNASAGGFSQAGHRIREATGAVAQVQASVVLRRKALR